MEKLNANENIYNIDESFVEEIIEIVKNKDFNRYPDANGEDVKIAFGKYLSVDKDRIAIGNGSDEILGSIIRFYINSGDKVLLMKKDFVMFSVYLKQNEGVPVYFDNTVDFQIDELIQMAREENVKMIIFSNPNNPLGSQISKEDIRKILEELPNVLLVLDEAYTEFSGISFIDEVENYDNLFITRTTSKAIGMASIRVGACVSSVENIEYYESQKTPFNVSTLSQKIAVLALSEKNLERVEKNLKLIIAERDRLYSELASLDLKDIVVYPSKANFLYFEAKNKEDILKRFDEEDIIITDFPNDDSFRISVGSREANDSIINIFKEFCK